MITLRKITFVKSSPDVSDCPVSELPEYAFIGRSNVGKSSLINMICNQKIAKTSSTPGKTQLINHFMVNDEWYLVDLPGYGFAKINRQVKATLEPMIAKYILERPTLVCLFLLIDIRLEPQKRDLDFFHFLGKNGIPFHIIFTKSDKLTIAKVDASVESYKKELAEIWETFPTYTITSSEKKIGKEVILGWINAYNKLPVNTQK